MARFLADESCDFAVIRALRSAGHEVRAIAESSPGATDEEVIRQSVNEERILLTEDTDFGELVYSRRRAPGGVILIRFPGGVREELAPQLLRFVDLHEDRLPGAFIVLQPGRARIGRLPGTNPPG